MQLTLPDFCLAVLIGASCAGKSTFARQHFRPTEVLSSDRCRALVRDDETDQAATYDAFQVLHLILAKRLAAHRLTVIDATNAKRRWRRPLLIIARQHRCPAVAIVLDLPQEELEQRNQARPRRSAVDPAVIERHVRNIRLSLDGLQEEGFQAVHILRSAAEVDAVVIKRQRLVELRLDHRR